MSDNSSKPFSGCLNPEEAYSAGKTSGSFTHPEIIAAVGRTSVGQTQTGVPTNQSSPDRRTANTIAPPRVKGPSSGKRHNTTKEVRWSDLTKYERALLREIRKDGILIGPEQIRKMASQIYYRPHAKPLAAIHILGETEDGQMEQLFEARRAEIDAFNKHKPPNPDFKRLWGNTLMKLSLNLPHGWLGLSAHGGEHHIKTRLWPHDENDILASLIGHRYASLGRSLPKEFKFDKGLREKIKAAYDCFIRSPSLATASQFERGPADRQGPGEDRGFDKISVRKMMQEKNGGRLRERHGGKFSRTLTEARRLKRYLATARQRMAARGFTFPLTISGILRNRETGRREYRRIELYKASEWTRREVAWLHGFFKRHIPRSRGAVFAFHNNKLYLDEKDPLLKFIKPVSQVEQRSGSYAEFMRRRHMSELASVGDIQ